MKTIIVIFLASSASSLAFSAEPQGPWTLYQPGAEQVPSEDEGEVEQSPQCEPDRSKWSDSSVDGYYYLKEASILGAKNNRYIRIWTSKVKNQQNCTFEKQYITIDCISNAVGPEWYSLKPVDPDLDFYSVVKDICSAYAEEPEAPKARKK
jgi:hypothetical protein